MRQRKIYLAGASSEYLRVRAIMDLLREQGHIITHDWTVPVEQMVLSRMSESSLFEDEASARVQECATGVRECDTFVLLVPRSTTITWGAPIELGLAWALGKDIFFLGALAGIFRTIATCTVSSESLLLQALRVDA
jgi:hypothetical protein